jgi:flavodoxin
MKKILLSMAMMACFATCYAQKALVLFYSQTGTTKTVAEELQKQLGADIESVEADKPIKSNLSKYDVIFLGYPIWSGTYATPMATVIKSNDFAGKTIVPFCTFGSGGLNTSSDALKKALPKAKIQTGYGVRAARIASASKEIDRFLKENGYKKGTVKKLSDYSAQQPVTDADKAIFDAACSNYQFPLGTPQTVGKRTTDDSTDYKYTVKSRGFDGKEGTTIIYVTVGKQAGAKPEFTEVVR